MSLEVGRYRLYSAQKTLQGHWEEARLHWSDSVCQEFAKVFYDEIEPRVLTTLAAIDRLAQVLSRVRQDCE